MSHRRRASRRALVLVLALAVGPAAVLAPTVATAVTDPDSVDVPLADDADSLAFDDGRLLTNSGPGSARSTRVDTVTVPLVGDVTIATGTATYAPTALSTPDRHTFATSAGVDVVSFTNGRVHVRRGATKLLDLAAPAGNAWSVDISGFYVRVGSGVYDIRRGTSPIYTQPTTTTASALHGSRLVWSEANGTVRLRDVATNNVPTVLRAGTKNCTTCGQHVAINSTTVAYGAPGGWLGLTDVASGQGRAKALLLTGVERFRLGEGFLATTAADGIALYRLNDPLTLSTPTPYLLGTHVVDLAADGHAFAYLRADGSVTVEQLPDAVDGQQRPTLLGAAIAGAFSPNNDKVVDTWTPTFVLTRPVTTWKLEVVDPRTKAVVATFASAVGAPPTATIGAVWKPSGSRPQAGYPWTLTGTGTDGTVVQASGAAVAGVVNLRRTNDRTSVVKAPANVAIAGRSARTPLSWKPAGGFPSGVWVGSYDVQTRTVRISKKGKRLHGKPRAVLSRTAKTSTTYAGTRGATYQFRVRNKDSVGLVGPWSTWAVSNTPLDDRSKGVRYGKGWKSAKAAGRWNGTHHWTKKAKRTLTVDRRVTSGFALVARTCVKCGSVKVYVDGKLRRTVNLGTSSTMRREVYSINFKKPGRHSLRIVTVVNGKKKLVAIDAILIRH